MVQSELVIIEDAPLTEDEESARARCEQTIDQGLKTFYAVGNALAEIRDERLYRATHRTFEDYCQERWGIARAYANRLIAAAETVDNLAPIGAIPANEAQARALTGLKPEQQREVWQAAIDTAPNGKVTAPHIEHVRREWVPDDQNVFTDPEADEYAVIVEERKATPMAVHFSSESDQHNTPYHIIERVIQVFGQIDIDPCSNSHETPNVPALQHYTWEDDGITKPWHGNVYMNPPYGDEIGQWTERLWRAYEDGEIAQAIALLPARTDTLWFRPLMKHLCCFIHGRLKFSNAENSAPFPSVVVYLGPDKDGFVDAFEEAGTIMRKV